MTYKPKHHGTKNAEEDALAAFNESDGDIQFETSQKPALVL